MCVRARVHACDLQCVLSCGHARDLQYRAVCACLSVCVCVSCAYTRVMWGVCLRTLLPWRGPAKQVLPSNRWVSHRGVNPGVGVRAFAKCAEGSVCAE